MEDERTESTQLDEEQGQTTEEHLEEDVAEDIDLSEKDTSVDPETAWTTTNPD
jgi:hypothetical protein